ncbi:MAG: hypothetical protein KGQ70_06645 [Alphaproteobacteria bacterium]|nr:hypothetical protein [Alphaproteobacteria bacterium]
MPPCDGAKEFYDAACKLGPVKFLTAPVLSEGCFSGKAAWVQSFVPERGREALKDLIICPGADKYFIAAPGRILIDDREKNVREWSAAGGISIHHKGDFAETLEALRKAVAALDAPSQKPRAAKRSNAPRQ